jgi:hypothetical protein
MTEQEEEDLRRELQLRQSIATSTPYRTIVDSATSTHCIQRMKRKLVPDPATTDQLPDIIA